MKAIKAILAAVAAFAATGCTSYEIDMPENPAPPTVGPEVSTNVIYQANPRFFGDNECLDGIAAQLGRIAGMNTDILWIMPVYETGELNAFGSPYCVRNFTALNPRYGTMADAKALVDAAHAKGMKVIFDWIANHTAWDCAWIAQHPDWYEHDANGNIVNANGWTDVAQLDFSNQNLRAAMTDAMIFWIKELGIDGYRCDYAEGVPIDYWSEAITAMRALNPELIMLAETSHAEYYEAGFDMIYDWKSGSTISEVFHGDKPSKAVSEAQSALSVVPEGDSILRYVFNHDTAAENNVATMFGAPEGIPAAYVLASMLNGTPMIYSSMDVEGLSGKLSFFNYNPLTFSQALSDKFAAINAAFRSSAEVRRGQLADLSTSSVVCFTRSIPGHTLMVAVNPTADTKSIRTPIMLTGASMTDLLTGATVTVPVTLELGAYGYAIYMN